MSPLHSISLLTLLTVFLASCQQQQKAQTEETTELSPEIRELCESKGNEASQALMTNLSTQLKAAMTNGGSVAAVEVCKQVAQPSTDAISSGLDGLTISRTSLKVRNPENAPDDLDRETLEAWQQLDDQGKPLPDSQLISIDDSTVRYYKPIVTQDLCVKCHGPSDALAPELITLLDQLYPEDQARGYESGKLRGAFKVEIDLKSLEQPES